MNGAFVDALKRLEKQNQVGLWASYVMKKFLSLDAQP